MNVRLSKETKLSHNRKMLKISRLHIFQGWQRINDTESEFESKISMN